VAKYLHEINRIIECLREAEQVIKPEEKMFYLLNGLPATWCEWRDLQVTIIKPDQPDELVAAIKAHEASLNRDQGIADDTVLSVEGKRYAGRAGGKSNRRPEQARPEQARPEQARPERRNRSSTDETLTC